jgi:hypothetical protein
MTSSQHAYEVRPRKDKRGFDLISDALPFGRLWHGDSEAKSRTQSVVPLAPSTFPELSNPALGPRFAVAPCKNRYDGTKSDCVTILQLSISDKIAIDLCPVR